MKDPILSLDDEQIVTILRAGNYIKEEDLQAAKKHAETYRSSLVDYFLTHRLLTKDLLGQAVAESYQATYIDLNSHQVTREQVLKIPERIARRCRAVLYSEDNKTVTVATDDPKQSTLPKQLADVFPGKEIRLGYSLPEDIKQAFIHYRKELETRLLRIIQNTPHAAPLLIDEVMADALTVRASDVHFEPQGLEVVIRFRIDDVLQEVGRLPPRHYETMINRIKVMAQLRTDEHLAAQDGAIRYKLEQEEVDLRVSIAPIVDGEKVAIRILSRYVREFNLGNLGLSEANQAIVNRAARMPFGMVLVSGPTGSGKTTTLYALIKTLNRPEVNITTIEDPVEYKIAGVNHIQVNEHTQLTFARGLRTIVRQDPDIILVGEIRDEETADIAVNAALTGHLLFSTFHANDAATAIPRLLDMDIEPFLLASTLEVVIAQRLVRRLSEEHRVSYTTNTKELKDKFPGVEKYLGSGQITLYRGQTDAPNDGYSGRMAIFEVIKVTPAMQELILRSPSSQEIRQLARKQGSQSMFADGIEKVKQGITTIEEVFRVASPPVTN